jgi:hypothetical protein
MLLPFRRSAFLRHDSAIIAPSQTAAASSNVVPVVMCEITPLTSGPYLS